MATWGQLRMEPLPALGTFVVRASCELDDAIKQDKFIIYKDLSMKAPLITVMFASLLALTACTVTITTPTPDVGAPAPTSAASAASAVTATSTAPAWEPAACAALDVADIVAAVADCGYITVPEKRGESGGALGDKFIRLGVVRLRATSENPGTPIIVGTGGPGGDGLLFLNSEIGPSVNLPALYAPVLAGRDLIYFTQRGTKGATPELYCPEFDAVGYNAARSGWSQAEREEQYTTTLRACADAVAAEGIDLSAYNSNENAADIDDLRRGLGYDQIIYYGQSYGTVLGQFLMRNYPDSLEAVILDGTQPVEYKTYAAAFDIPASFRRVFAACAADAACNASYPDPEATLDELMAAFRAKPQACHSDRERRRHADVRARRRGDHGWAAWQNVHQQRHGAGGHLPSQGE